MAKNDYFGGSTKPSILQGPHSSRTNSPRSTSGSDVVAISEEIDQLAAKINSAKAQMADQIATYASQVMNGYISVPNNKTATSHLESMIKKMQLPPDAVAEILVAALAKIIMNG